MSDRSGSTASEQAPQGSGRRAFLGRAGVFAGATALGGALLSDPAAASAVTGIQFVSVDGSDTNDGLSWTTAKATANAAITALAGPGIVYLGRGTFSGSVVIKTGVVLQGLGMGASVLTVPNGANAPVVKSENFDNSILRQGGYQGIYQFGLLDLAIDGNKAGQTTSQPGIQLYGYGFFLERLAIRSCKGQGIYSEWLASTGFVAPDDMMANMRHVRVHDCDNHGVEWNGPHDSHFIDVHSFNNRGIGFRIGAASGGMSLVNCQTYGTDPAYTWGVYTEATGTYLINGDFNNAGTGQVFLGANQCQVIGGQVSGNEPASATGIQIGDGGHTFVANYVVNTLFNTLGGAGVSFVSDGGGAVSGWIYSGAAAPAWSGTPHAATKSEFWVLGTATGGGAVFPGGFTLRNSSTEGLKLIRASDGYDILRVDQFNNVFTFNKSALLRGYFGNLDDPAKWIIQSDTG